jgi:hypothetical protein
LDPAGFHVLQLLFFLAFETSMFIQVDPGL